MAGGFHTGGIIHELRKRKISYAVVSPAIEKISGRDLYPKLMIEYGSALTPASLNPDKNSTRLLPMFKAIPVYGEDGGLDVARTLSTWGTQQKYHSGLIEELIRESGSGGGEQFIDTWMRVLEIDSREKLVLLRNGRTRFVESHREAVDTLKLLAPSGATPDEIYRGLALRGKLIPVVSPESPGSTSKPSTAAGFGYADDSAKLEIARNLGFEVEPGSGRLKYKSDYRIPKITADIWIVRHGETESIAQSKKDGKARFQRQADGLLNQLSAAGKKDPEVAAQKVFKMLREKIKSDASSVIVIRNDLGRVRDTEAPFVEKVKRETGKTLTVIDDPESREINFGEWDNLTHTEQGNPMLKEIEAKLGRSEADRAQQYLKLSVLASAPSGESFIELLDRAHRYLLSIEKRFPGKTIVLFNHGTFSSALRILMKDPVMVDMNGFINWRAAMLLPGEPYRLSGAKIGFSAALGEDDFGNDPDVLEQLERAVAPWQRAQERLNEAGFRETAQMVRLLFPVAVRHYYVKSHKASAVHRIAHTLDFMSEIMLGEGVKDRTEIKRGLAAALLHDVGISKTTIEKIRKVDVEENIRMDKARIDALKLPEVQRKTLLRRSIRRHTGRAIQFTKVHMKKGSSSAALLMYLYNDDHEDFFSSGDVSEVRRLVEVHDNPSIQAYEQLKNNFYAEFGISEFEPPKNRLFDADDRLMMFLREADRLWMITKDGIAFDLSRKQNGESVLRRAAKSVRRFSEEARLYIDTLPDAQARYGFKNGLLFRTESGYKIFERLIRTLIEESGESADSPLHEQLALLPEGFPRGTKLPAGFGAEQDYRGAGTTWDAGADGSSNVQKATRHKLLLQPNTFRPIQATSYFPLGGFGGIANQPNINVNGTINDSMKRVAWEEPENQEEARPAAAAIMANVSKELPTLSLRYGSNMVSAFLPHLGFLGPLGLMAGERLAQKNVFVNNKLINTQLPRPAGFGAAALNRPTARSIVDDALAMIKEEFRTPGELKRRGIEDFAHHLGFKEIIYPGFPEFRKAQPVVHVLPEVWNSPLKNHRMVYALRRRFNHPPPHTGLSFYKADVPSLNGPGLYYHPQWIKELARDKGIRIRYADFLRVYLNAQFYERGEQVMDDLDYVTYKTSLGSYLHREIFRAERELLLWLGDDESEIYIRNKEIELETKHPVGAEEDGSPPGKAVIHAFEDQWRGIINQLRRGMEDDMEERDAFSDEGSAESIDPESFLDELFERAGATGTKVKPSSVPEFDPDLSLPERARREAALEAHYDMWARVTDFTEAEFRKMYLDLRAFMPYAKNIRSWEENFRPGNVYFERFPAEAEGVFETAILVATAKVGAVYHFLAIYPNGLLGNYTVGKSGRWGDIRLIEPRAIEDLIKNGFAEKTKIVSLFRLLEILKSPSLPEIPPPNAGFGSEGGKSAPHFDLRTKPEQLFPIAEISRALVLSNPAEELSVDIGAFNEDKIDLTLWRVRGVARLATISIKSGNVLKVTKKNPDLSDDIAGVIANERTFHSDRTTENAGVDNAVIRRTYYQLNQMATITLFDLDYSLRKKGIEDIWYRDYIEPFLKRSRFPVAAVQETCLDCDEVPQFWRGQGFVGWFLLDPAYHPLVPSKYFSAKSLSAETVSPSAAGFGSEAEEKSVSREDEKKLIRQLHSMALETAGQILIGKDERPKSFAEALEAIREASGDANNKHHETAAHFPETYRKHFMLLLANPRTNAELKAEALMLWGDGIRYGLDSVRELTATSLRNDLVKMAKNSRAPKVQAAALRALSFLVETSMTIMSVFNESSGSLHYSWDAKINAGVRKIFSPLEEIIRENKNPAVTAETIRLLLSDAGKTWNSRKFYPAPYILEKLLPQFEDFVLRKTDGSLVKASLLALEYLRINRREHSNHIEKVFERYVLESESQSGKEIRRAGVSWASPEVRTELKQKMPTLFKILSQKGRTARFLTLLSVFRIAHPFDQMNGSNRTAKAWSIENGVILPLRELRIAPVSESFRRDIIFNEDDSLTIEIKFPGQRASSGDVFGTHLILARELRKTFGDDTVVEPLFHMSFKGTFDLYDPADDQSWFDDIPLGIAAFRYEDGKRLRNVLINDKTWDDFVAKTYGDKSHSAEAMVQIGADILAHALMAHMLGYRTSKEDGALSDLHTENFRLIRGRAVSVGDFGTYKFLGNQLSEELRAEETSGILNQLIDLEKRFAPLSAPEFLVKIFDRALARLTGGEFDFKKRREIIREVFTEVNEPLDDLVVPKRALYWHFMAGEPGFAEELNMSEVGDTVRREMFNREIVEGIIDSRHGKLQTFGLRYDRSKKAWVRALIERRWLGHAGDLRPAPEKLYEFEMAVRALPEDDLREFTDNKESRIAFVSGLTTLYRVLAAGSSEPEVESIAHHDLDKPQYYLDDEILEKPAEIIQKLHEQIQLRRSVLSLRPAGWVKPTDQAELAQWRAKEAGHYLSEREKIRQSHVEAVKTFRRETLEELAERYKSGGPDAEEKGHEQIQNIILHNSEFTKSVLASSDAGFQLAVMQALRAALKFYVGIYDGTFKQSASITPAIEADRARSSGFVLLLANIIRGLAGPIIASSKFGPEVETEAIYALNEAATEELVILGGEGKVLQLPAFFGSYAPTLNVFWGIWPQLQANILEHENIKLTEASMAALEGFATSMSGRPDFERELAKTRQAYEAWKSSLGPSAAGFGAEVKEDPSLRGRVAPEAISKPRLLRRPQKRTPRNDDQPDDSRATGFGAEGNQAFLNELVSRGFGLRVTETKGKPAREERQKGAGGKEEISGERASSTRRSTTSGRQLGPSKTRKPIQHPSYSSFALEGEHAIKAAANSSRIRRRSPARMPADRAAKKPDAAAAATRTFTISMNVLAKRFLRDASSMYLYFVQGNPVIILITYYNFIQIISQTALPVNNFIRHREFHPKSLPVRPKQNDNISDGAAGFGAESIPVSEVLSKLDRLEDHLPNMPGIVYGLGESIRKHLAKGGEKFYPGEFYLSAERAVREMENRVNIFKERPFLQGIFKDKDSQITRLLRKQLFAAADSFWRMVPVIANAVLPGNFYEIFEDDWSEVYESSDFPRSADELRKWFSEQRLISGEERIQSLERIIGVFRDRYHELKVSTKAAPEKPEELRAIIRTLRLLKAWQVNVNRDLRLTLDRGRPNTIPIMLPAEKEDGAGFGAAETSANGYELPEKNTLSILVDKIALGAELSAAELERLKELTLLDGKQRKVFGVTPENVEWEVQARIELFRKTLPAFRALMRELEIDDLTPLIFWNIYIPLSLWLYRRKLEKRPEEAYVIGFSGGLGVGKTTRTKILGLVLTELLKERGEQVVIFSIDDLYKSKAEREALKSKGYFHRGPPGTHDVNLGVEALRSLRHTTADSQVALPVFDKSTDDRSNPRLVKGKVGIVLFEGWIVGANTDIEPELVESGFKREVAKALREYKPLFDEVDDLVVRVLRDLDAIKGMYHEQVRRERARTERGGKPWQGLEENQIDRFVESFYIDPWDWIHTSPEPRLEDTSLMVITDDRRNIIDMQLGGRALPFKGKTVLVTGGGTGLGREAALKFADLGAHIVLMGRRYEMLQSTAREIAAKGRRVLVTPGSVSRQSDLEAVFARVEKEFGSIDILVNNAGVSGPVRSIARQPLEDESSGEPDFRETVKIHLGAWTMAQRAVKLARAKKKPLTIVNVITRFSPRERTDPVPYPFRLPYVIAQAIKNFIGRAMAWELAAEDIAVINIAFGPAAGSERIETVVYPRGALERQLHGVSVTAGDIRTKTAELHPGGKFVTLKDVAESIIFAASESGRKLGTGEAWSMGGGLDFAVPPNTVVPTSLGLKPDLTGKNVLILGSPENARLKTVRAGLEESGASVFVSLMSPAQLSNAIDQHFLRAGRLLDQVVVVPDDVPAVSSLLDLSDETRERLIEEQAVLPFGSGAKLAVAAFILQSINQISDRKAWTGIGTIQSFIKLLERPGEEWTKEEIQVFQTALQNAKGNLIFVGPEWATASDSKKSIDETTKRALEAWRMGVKAGAESLAAELAGTKTLICSNAVIPGKLSGKPGDPEALARTILYLSAPRRNVSGLVIYADERNAQTDFISLPPGKSEGGFGVEDRTGFGATAKAAGEKVEEIRSRIREIHALSDSIEMNQLYGLKDDRVAQNEKLKEMQMAYLSQLTEANQSVLDIFEMILQESEERQSFLVGELLPELFSLRDWAEKYLELSGRGIWGLPGLLRIWAYVKQQDFNVDHVLKIAKKIFKQYRIGSEKRPIPERVFESAKSRADYLERAQIAVRSIKHDNWNELYFDMVNLSDLMGKLPSNRQWDNDTEQTFWGLHDRIALYALGRESKVFDEHELFEFVHALNELKTLITKDLDRYFVSSERALFERYMQRLSQNLEIIDDLLSFIEGDIESRKSTFALGPLVEEALRAAVPRRFINRKQVSLALTGLDGVNIRADRRKILNLYRLLFNNSCQVWLERNPDPKLRPPLNLKVTFEERDGVPVVGVHEVMDNAGGARSDPTLLDFVEPSRQKAFLLNVSRRKGDTGLGLAEAWWIVNLHGGEIQFSNLTEKNEIVGAKFSVSLPHTGFGAKADRSTDEKLAREIAEKLRRADPAIAGIDVLVAFMSPESGGRLDIIQRVFGEYLMPTTPSELNGRPRSRRIIDLVTSILDEPYAGFGVVLDEGDRALLEEIGLKLVDDLGHIGFRDDFRKIPLEFDLRIVPHGTTKANELGIFSGSHEETDLNQLSPEGERQAQEGAKVLWNELGGRLKAGETIYFLHSPLPRAKRTADYFVEYAKTHGVEIKLIPEPGAIEMALDEWNSAADGDAYRNFNALARPKSGESYLRFLKRVKQFVEKLNRQYKGKTVVVYGHRTFATALRVLLEGPGNPLTEPYIRWRDLVPNSERGKPVHFQPSGFGTSQSSFYKKAVNITLTVLSIFYIPVIWSVWGLVTLGVLSSIPGFHHALLGFETREAWIEHTPFFHNFFVLADIGAVSMLAVEYIWAVFQGKYRQVYTERMLKKSRLPDTEDFLGTLEKKGIIKEQAAKWFVEAESAFDLFTKLRAEKLFESDVEYLDSAFLIFAYDVWEYLDHDFLNQYPTSPIGERFGLTGRLVTVGKTRFHIIGLIHGHRIIMFNVGPVKDLVRYLSDQGIPLFSEEVFQEGYGYNYGRKFRDQEVASRGLRGVREILSVLDFVFFLPYWMIILGLAKFYPSLAGISNGGLNITPDYLAPYEFDHNGKSRGSCMARTAYSGSGRREGDVVLLMGDGHMNTALGTLEKIKRGLTGFGSENAGRTISVGGASDIDRSHREQESPRREPQPQWSWLKTWLHLFSLIVGYSNHAIIKIKNHISNIIILGTTLTLMKNWLANAAAAMILNISKSVFDTISFLFGSKSSIAAFIHTFPARISKEVNTELFISQRIFDKSSQSGQPYLQPAAGAGFGAGAGQVLPGELPDPSKGPADPKQSLIRDENWNGEEQTRWIYLGEITLREDAVEAGGARKRLVFAEERRIPKHKRGYGIGELFVASLLFVDPAEKLPAELPDFSGVLRAGGFDYEEYADVTLERKEDGWRLVTFYPAGGRRHDSKTQKVYAGSGISRLVLKYIQEALAGQNLPLYVDVHAARFAPIRHFIQTWGRSVRTIGWSEKLWEDVEEVKKEGKFFAYENVGHVTIVRGFDELIGELWLKGLGNNRYEIVNVFLSLEEFSYLAKGRVVTIPFPGGDVFFEENKLGRVSRTDHDIFVHSRTADDLNDELTRPDAGFGRANSVKGRPAPLVKGLGPNVIKALVEEGIVTLGPVIHANPEKAARILRDAGYRTGADIQAKVELDRQKILERIESLDLNTLIISADTRALWVERLETLRIAFGDQRLRPLLVAKFAQVLGLLGDLTAGENDKLISEIRDGLGIPSHRAVVVANFQRNLKVLQESGAIPLKLDLTKILLLGEIPPNLEILLGERAASLASAELFTLIDRFAELEQISKTFAAAA